MHSKLDHGAKLSSSAVTSAKQHSCKHFDFGTQHKFGSLLLHPLPENETKCHLFDTVGETKHASQIVRAGLPGSALRLTAVDKKKTTRWRIAAKYKSGYFVLLWTEFQKTEHTSWPQLLPSLDHLLLLYWNTAFHSHSTLKVYLIDE